MVRHRQRAPRPKLAPRSKLSRRELGATAAAGLLGLAAGGYRRSARASPPDRLRLAAIGVGNRGADNLGMVSGEQIVALCDVDDRYLERAKERYPDARTYHDFRELFAQEKLDGVVISTPDHTHHPAAMLALGQNLHVYCEKPLANSVTQVDQLAELAQTSRGVTQMGNQHHRAAGYRDLIEVVRSGEYGPVEEVHVWSDRPLWKQGQGTPRDEPPVPAYLHWDLWLGPAPPRPYHPQYHPFGWRGFWDFGSGALGDMGPHLLDPVFQALDLGTPAQVQAESAEAPPGSAPAWSIVRFEFPARDTLPPVRLTWYDGDKQPPREITGLERLPLNGMLLLGRDAKFFAPEQADRMVILDRQGKAIRRPPRDLPPVPNHHAAWLLACRGEAPGISDFSYGARLTRCCLLGNEAIRKR